MAAEKEQLSTRGPSQECFSISLVSEEDFFLLPKEPRQEVFQAVNRMISTGGKEKWKSTFLTPIPLKAFGCLGSCYGQICTSEQIINFINPQEFYLPENDLSRVRWMIKEIRRALDRNGIDLKVYTVGGGRGYLLTEPFTPEGKKILLPLTAQEVIDELLKIDQIDVQAEIQRVFNQATVKGNYLASYLSQREKDLLLKLALRFGKLVFSREFRDLGYYSNRLGEKLIELSSPLRVVHEPGKAFCWKIDESFKT